VDEELRFDHFFVAGVLRNEKMKVVKKTGTMLPPHKTGQKKG